MNAVDTYREERRIVQYMSQIIKCLCPVDFPLGIMKSRISPGVAWVAPDMTINRMLIKSYVSKPGLVMRLYVNVYSDHDGSSFNAVGIKLGSPMANGLKDGKRRLEFSFVPSEASRVSSWAASWIPRYHESSVPVEYENDLGLPHFDLAKHAYMWSKQGNEEYQKLIGKLK